MQTKRDYLVGLGLAKPGRGKFSNVAKEALAKAESKGMKFADSLPEKRTGPQLTKKTESKGGAGQNDPTLTPYLTPDEYRFPESEYRAVGDNGKRYSLRECCNTCMVSLVNHACNSPTVHDNVTIRIERR